MPPHRPRAARVLSTPRDPGGLPSPHGVVHGGRCRASPPCDAGKPAGHSREQWQSRSVVQRTLCARPCARHSSAERSKAQASSRPNRRPLPPQCCPARIPRTNDGPLPVWSASPLGPHGKLCWQAAVVGERRRRERRRTSIPGHMFSRDKVAGGREMCQRYDILVADTRAIVSRNVRGRPAIMFWRFN